MPFKVLNHSLTVTALESLPVNPTQLVLSSMELPEDGDYS